MLTKQGIDISFAQGLDTKTDPKRVAMGNFVSLQNTVFNKGGLLQKRNGYGQLASLPDNSSTYLTTLNGNLTAVGTSIAAYNESNMSWVSRGSIQPMSIETLPLLRNNLNQTACDSAVAVNGLVCTAYLETNGSTITNKYVIADSVTGQNIVASSVIPVSSGTVSGGMRVFVLGSYFIIVFTNTITATAHLQYIAISTNNPTVITSNTDLSSSYIAFSTLSWDGVIVNNNLYVAYNTTSGGQQIKVLILSPSLTQISGTAFVGYKGTMMTMTADLTTTPSTYIYITFYNAANSTGYTAIVNQNINVVMNPVQVIPSGTILNLASAAQNGICKIFYEVSNVYSFDSAIASNYINSISITPVRNSFRSIFSIGAGTITVSSATGLSNGMTLIDNTTASNIAAGTTFTISGTTLTLLHNTAGNSASSPGDLMAAATVSSVTTIVRSVGLASKAFIVDGIIYFLSAYSFPDTNLSPAGTGYQPTYFLINGSTSLSSAPVVAAKLAYENGGGYLATGLPSVTIQNSNEAKIAYLFKDLIQAVNKNTNVPAGSQVAGIYSQTGINLGTFTIGTQSIDSAEIGGDLHLSGGFLWMYDGYLPVEHNFFLWPDTDQVTPANIAIWTENSVVTPTGSFASGATTVVVSSATGISVGMTIADTSNSSYIPAGTIITDISGTTLTISKATTHVGSGDTLSIQGNIASKPDSSTLTNAYYYQFTYEWTDNVGNAYRSAPSIPIAVTTTGAVTTGTITLKIPTLRLTYKTANPVKIVIYRWSVGQQEYYQVTSITRPLLNDTTIDSVSFVDTQPDANILGNNLIYTTGGVVEDVNAPASSLITLYDTRLWLVDAEDPNLLWFSKQVIENTPVEMSDLFTMFIASTTGAQGSTGPITAIAPLDDKLIIFKTNAIYYINGSGPDNTGANNQYSQPIFITATVGCDNQQSIVFMPQGLMFQSDKGIWLLDRGLNTSYIGAPVEQFNAGIVESAQNIPETNQVRFILSTGVTLMYDYFYGQWGTFVNIPAISGTLFQNQHTFLNSSGQVFQETPGTYVDGSIPVEIQFTTGPLRLDALQSYQRAYFFYILGQYLSPHKLYVSVYYDYSTTPSHSVLISPDNFSPAYGAGDSSSPFGQGTPYGGPAVLEQWRVFLNQQRCQAFAISVQEIYDSTFGVPAGAGLTISGLNVICGFKQKFRPIAAANSVG